MEDGLGGFPARPPDDLYWQMLNLWKDPSIAVESRLRRMFFNHRDEERTTF